ncbi:MAG: heme-binding protein [Aliidongia sp.]
MKITRKPLLATILACGCLSLASAASAGALPTARQLPLALASEAALEAVAVCEKSGYRVTATVVDASGLVKVVAKGDKAPPHTLDSSRGKAYSAVSLGDTFSETTTSAIVGRVVNNPAYGPLLHLPGVFLVPGGVMLKSGDEIVGAIGVGGAPGGDKDEVCAKAAADKIADRLK